MSNENLLTEKDLAALLGVNRRTLYYWRLDGMPFVSVGRLHVRYDFDVVCQWCKENYKNIKFER